MNTGSFASEVYVLAHNYRFNAQFNSRLWAAQVYDEAGVEICSIHCVTPRLYGQPETLEDALAEWVYRSVVCILDAGALPDITLIDTGIPVMPHELPAAANMCLFIPGTLLPVRQAAALPAGRMVTSSQLDLLHRRSVAAVQKFWAVAEEYQTVRDHDLLLPLTERPAGRGSK